MHDFASKVLWIYIVLLLVGGLTGFFKGKSTVSLVTSAIFATILIIAAIPHILDRDFARILINITMAVLLVVFAIRLAKTKKFMPAGLMVVATAAALILRNM